MKATKKFKAFKTRFNLIPVMLIITALFLSSCNDDDEVMSEPYVKNIVEVAADAGQFSILIEAAQKAGLAEYLSTQDGITVFAPTDDAFIMLLSDLGLSS